MLTRSRPSNLLVCGSAQTDEAIRCEAHWPACDLTRLLAFLACPPRENTNVLITEKNPKVMTMLALRIEMP